MFSGDNTFYGDLSSWDVRSVAGMDGMFEGAASFNQNLSIGETNILTVKQQIFLQILDTISNSPNSGQQSPFCASSSCPMSQH